MGRRSPPAPTVAGPTAGRCTTSRPPRRPPDRSGHRAPPRAEGEPAVRFAEQFGDMTVPFHEYAGMTIEVGSPATVTVPLGDSIRGAFNPLHGGIAASLADVACATALTSELGAG